MPRTDVVGELLLDKEAERPRKEVAKEAAGEDSEVAGGGVLPERILEILYRAAKKRPAFLTDSLGKRAPKSEGRQLAERTRLRIVDQFRANPIADSRDEGEGRAVSRRPEPKLRQGGGEILPPRRPGDAGEQPKAIGE